VSFLYQDGSFRAEFARVAHRMDPPIGGSSVVHESIPAAPDLRRAGRELVRATELEGYSEVEFRRDRVGRLLLVEINPRLSAAVEIAVRAGSTSLASSTRLRQGTLSTNAPGYSTGIRMRCLGGDIRWLASSLTTETPRRPDR
jgi:predicted ATP-grasp superfamily ATP-dependent carboligase